MSLKLVKINHTLDGWLRMSDGSFHFFCGLISLCAEWFRVAGRYTALSKYHAYPVCARCWTTATLVGGTE